MALDPSLRKELEQARDVLFGTINEVRWRAIAPSARAPNYQSALEELERQLKEVEELLREEDQGQS
jgi:hypothetical protein